MNTQNTDTANETHMLYPHTKALTDILQKSLTTVYYFLLIHKMCYFLVTFTLSIRNSKTCLERFHTRGLIKTCAQYASI